MKIRKLKSLYFILCPLFFCAAFFAACGTRITLLSAEEEAGLAPGDYLLLPEMSAEKPGRVCLPGTLAPDRLRVIAAERADIPFATALQDELRCAPVGTDDLLLMKGDRRMASGRLSKLGEQPAFAVEALC